MNAVAFGRASFSAARVFKRRCGDGRQREREAGRYWIRFITGTLTRSNCASSSFGRLIDITGWKFAAIFRENWGIELARFIFFASRGWLARSLAPEIGFIDLGADGEKAIFACSARSETAFYRSTAAAAAAAAAGGCYACVSWHVGNDVIENLARISLYFPLGDLIFIDVALCGVCEFDWLVFSSSCTLDISFINTASVDSRWFNIKTRVLKIHS